MTNTKKILQRFSAAILVIMMICGCAVSISAKKYDDIGSEYPYAEQIDILSDIGVIVGTSENEFSPNEPVTREQMAMLLFRTMLARDNAGIVNGTAFEDLYDETYNGAISWANAAGYIIGTSDKTFEPKKGITLQDAMTMIVRVLGQSNANMNRGYPWTFIDMAVKLGLDDGLRSVGYEKELTRGETAALLYNALTAEYLVPKTASASGAYYISTTIIQYVFGFEIEDCQIIATNNYSLSPAVSTVKEGYVTVVNEDGNMTVKFSDFGLGENADMWLGKSVKLIYKTDAKTKMVNVLGASYTNKAENAQSFSVAADKSYVLINNVKYNVVKQRSNALATNDNELLVYIYGSDRQLSQVENNTDFAGKAIYCDIELIYGADSSTAIAAIIKNYTFGRLTENAGKINLAGDLTIDKLSEFKNEVKAVYGDYVLYYFNAANKVLEIKERFTPTDAAIVTKLTASEAVIGGKTYKLGGGGVSAASIEAALKVGSIASVITKDDCILAVIGAAVQTVEAKYLVAANTAVPVFTNGSVKYVFDANIDGTIQSVITTSSGIAANTTYRYTVDSNGIYTLYAENSDRFAINGDFSAIFNAEDEGSLSMGSKPYYTLDDIKFVTDAKTVIIAKNASGWQIKTGVFTANIAIKEDAKITAVFHNNPGDVKTLAFMFIEGATLGRTDVTASNVKIIAAAGSEFEGGIVYKLYTALNLKTGAIETYKSASFELEAGKVYVLDTNNRIFDIASSDLEEGKIEGYTASTVTIDDEIYSINAQTVIIKINANNTTTAVTLASLSGADIEFAAANGAVTIIIAK